MTNINIYSSKVTMTDGTIYRFVDPFVNLGDVLANFAVAPPSYLYGDDESAIALRLGSQLALPAPQFVTMYGLDPSAATTPPTGYNSAFSLLIGPVGTVNRALIEKIESDTPLSVSFPN